MLTLIKRHFLTKFAGDIKITKFARDERCAKIFSAGFAQMKKLLEFFEP